MGIDPFLAAAAATALFTLALFVLPAYVELRRPRDAGPRIIRGCIEVTHVSPVLNIEFDAQKPMFSTRSLLDMLPNLEAEVT